MTGIDSGGQDGSISVYKVKPGQTVDTDKSVHLTLHDETISTGEPLAVTVK